MTPKAAKTSVNQTNVAQIEGTFDSRAVRVVGQNTEPGDSPRTHHLPRRSVAERRCRGLDAARTGVKSFDLRDGPHGHPGRSRLDPLLRRCTSLRQFPNRICHVESTWVPLSTMRCCVRDKAALSFVANEASSLPVSPVRETLRREQCGLRRSVNDAPRGRLVGLSRLGTRFPTCRRDGRKAAQARWSEPKEYR